MKRSAVLIMTLALLTAVFLSPTLVSAQAEAAQSALSDPDMLRMTSVKISKTTQDIVLRMTLENVGDAAIIEFGVALAFYDANGDRLLAYATTLEGYVDEVSYWYYEPSDAIQPGDTYKTEDTFAGYGGTGKLEAAIRYYLKASGEYVNIPESQWIWFSSEAGVLNEKTVRTYYGNPGNDIVQKTASMNLGYRFYLLDDYNAALYGFEEGGEWISEVEIGSLSDQAGLMAGDLVTLVGGVKPTENTYAVEYALAKAADGASVEWVIMRDGTEMTSNLTANK